MTYAKRLQAAMDASGKSRKALAEAIDVSVQAIGMVLTSAGGIERNLATETSAKAAKYLRVDCYWLATGEGTMRPTTGAAYLSDDAAELGIYFDKLKHEEDRTRAYVGAMAVILKIEAERRAASTAAPTAEEATPAPTPAENPEKRSV